VATVELDLHRHLFGSDRVTPPKALRDGIAALQDGQCFYCGRTLGVTSETDHFIPRIRSGIDAIENLVLADQRCNNDKRDLLHGPAHVTAWARRNQRHGTALTGLATASRWHTDPAATVAVARSIYSHLPPGAHPAVAGLQGCRQCRPSHGPSCPGLKNRRTRSVRASIVPNPAAFHPLAPAGSAPWRSTSAADGRRCQPWCCPIASRLPLVRCWTPGSARHDRVVGRVRTPGRSGSRRSCDAALLRSA